MKKFIAYSVFALLFTGCAKQTLAPSDYVKWVRDESNGLKVEKEISGHLFQLQYKPAAYEMLMQTPDNLLTRQSLSEYNASAGDLQFYTLTIVTSDHKEISTSGIADETEYEQRVMYMMSEMQYDFELIAGNDTLPCVFFHAERNFNISPQNNILLGFEKSNNTEKITDKTLIYYDRLLDCGPVKLTIKAEDIENIPELLLPE